MRLIPYAMIGAVITACSIGETSYETIELPVRRAKETRTCDSPFVTVDLANAKPCGKDGKSHCFAWAKSNVPKDQLEPCDDPDELCMPDKLLLAGGKKATACTFAGSEPGGCVPLAFKQVRENQSVLQQDACDEGERCAPCTDPRDGTDSGACAEQGVHEKECTGGPGDEGEVQTCCAGLGVCLNEKAVPEDSRSDMSSMGCKQGKLCAPAAMADNQGKKCETVAGFDGVCLPRCFAPMLRGMEGLSDDCGPFEVCLPCLIGAGQGMPGCE